MNIDKLNSRINNDLGFCSITVADNEGEYLVDIQHPHARYNLVLVVAVARSFKGFINNLEDACDAFDADAETAAFIENHSKESLFEDLEDFIKSVHRNIEEAYDLIELIEKKKEVI